MTKPILEAGDRQITWDGFKAAFDDKYFPPCVKQRKIFEFMHLTQGSQTVMMYERKFEELSRYAPHMVSTEEMKARKSKQGLRVEIQKSISPMQLKTYAEVVHKSQIYEAVEKNATKDEEVEPKKKFKKSFATPTTNKDNWKKFHKKNPQGTVDCTKCCKNHKSDCLVGTFTCFKRKEPGHLARNCPTLKEHPEPNPQGGQANQNAQNRKDTQGNQKPRASGRVFTLTKKDAEASPFVVAGMLKISGIPAYVPFDSGSTHSFVSSTFATKLNVVPKVWNYRLCVFTPSGGMIETELIREACDVEIMDRKLTADLILLEMKDFNIILGMDWLTAYHASVHCFEKRVVIRPVKEPEFAFSGMMIGTPPLVIISGMQAQKLWRQGSQGFLASVVDTEVKGSILTDVPIVRDFSDVFLEDLVELPPKRDMEFSIELVPGTMPISKAPYRMAPVELKELKNQLEELLDKGFIQPSVSPWGALILFVKKKDGTMRMCIDYRE
ncbi:uncharacterized protein LOC122650637 [Telopea speciosissima]|uniref:uncharacterized protein LOC122650637 n=1 Tax=Telopea speciosissima TaxID=54955 RepID=UPI001CC7C97C|nr:uncharacterized protein LOC122650637 [Telopea speciosissima]